MAKRFTDTGKWKKQWVRSLTPEMKLVWVYILDDCDVAGLWETDWDVLQIRLGIKTTLEEAVKELGDHVVVLDRGTKWFIPSFIEFQYGPELSKANNIYKSIAKILDKYDLYKYLTVEITDIGTTISAFRGRISRKTKERVFLESDCICQYCQERKSINELVVDHFVPLNCGGDNSDSNLVCSCVRCNSHKSDIAPNVFLLKNHQWLNPTEKIISLNKKLEGAFSDLSSPKDKDKEEDKVKVRGTVKEKDKDNLPDFEQYEQWSKDILSGDDWPFNDKLRNMNVPIGDRIGEFTTSHLALLAKYPKMRPTDQNRFRISLIGHIQEKLSERPSAMSKVKKQSYQEFNQP
jgi:hypothetical protein